MSVQKKNAFTLIELLVVIAIISILAAILFPVFARARGAARQTTCLSNSKQFATAFMMYMQDYDDRTPRAANPVIHRAVGTTTYSSSFRDLLERIAMPIDNSSANRTSRWTDYVLNQAMFVGVSCLVGAFVFFGKLLLSLYDLRDGRTSHRVTAN